MKTHTAFVLSVFIIFDIHGMNLIKPEITDDMIEQFCGSFGKVVTPETEALASKLSDAVFAEISLASRAPKPNEILAVQSLISMFNSYGVLIDEVRYMDAASLIFAMRLPGNMKQYCLSILEAPPREAISFIKVNFLMSCLK